MVLAAFHSTFGWLLYWHSCLLNQLALPRMGAVLLTRPRGVSRRASDACAGSSETSSEGELEGDLDMFVIVPHSEDRELGEPNIDDEGEVVIWDHPLPFFGQAVTELGFELPLPFGVSIVPATFEQDLTLRDLKLGLQGEADRPIEAVNFQNPSVRNTALQLKFDAWLFPFMNIFATLGRVDGRATVPLTVLGGDLFPELCETRVAPDVCERELSGTAKPNYDGTNWSVGTTLAMGWDQYFVVLPIVYAVSDIDILDTDVDALNVSPRVGINIELERYGDLSLFVGGTYLKAEVEVAGAITFDSPVGQGSTTLNYSLIEENKDAWNLALVGNWQITPAWGVMLEVGTGGSRTDVIAGLTHRF
jgi:hypothetical protein